MIGRLFSIIREIWMRPAVQASFWLILDSILIWIKDWIVTNIKNNPPQGKSPLIKRKRPQKNRVDNTSEIKPKSNTKSKSSRSKRTVKTNA